MSSTVIIAAKLYYFNDSVYLDLLKYMETSIFKIREGLDRISIFRGT